MHRTLVGKKMRLSHGTAGIVLWALVASFVWCADARSTRPDGTTAPLAQAFSAPAPAPAPPPASK